MAGKKKALMAGLGASAVEVVKQIPGLSVLVAGVSKYNETIQEEQKTQFINAIAERLEALRNSEWYGTPEGVEIAKKIVAIALNAELADKTDYFANAFLNSAESFQQAERLKFIQILRNVSKPALDILEAASRLHHGRPSYYSPQILVYQLTDETEQDPHLIESCVKELYSLGVFSSIPSYGSDGRPSTTMSEGTPAFTCFTERFMEFIKDPRGDFEA